MRYEDILMPGKNKFIEQPQRNNVGFQGLRLPFVLAQQIVALEEVILQYVEAFVLPQSADLLGRIFELEQQTAHTPCVILCNVGSS